MLSCFIKCGDDAGCVVLMVWLFLNNDSCDVFSRYKCTIQTTLCVRRGFNAREIVCNVCTCSSTKNPGMHTTRVLEYAYECNI